MNHLRNFESFNEGLFDVFSKNTIKYREEMKVSKRLKENNIEQVFDRENKKGNTSCYLVWKGDDGKSNDKVAEISLNGTDEYGRPIFKLNVFDNERVKISKLFLNQDSAAHHFLNYWESKTEEGLRKNKDYKIKKF